MWRGHTTSAQCEEPLFTTTGHTRWVLYRCIKDGHFNCAPPSKLTVSYCLMKQEEFLVKGYWKGWGYSDAWPQCPPLIVRPEHYWVFAAGCIDWAGLLGDPEEALRVAKWSLIHNDPPVLTAPPNPLSRLPLGSRAQTSRNWMMNCVVLSTGPCRPACSYRILTSLTKSVWGICFIFVNRRTRNRCGFDDLFLRPQQLNPLASQVAAAAAMGSIAGSQVFGNSLSNLQGATGQLVTNAQGQVGAILQMWINFLYIQLIKYKREKTLSVVTDILLHHQSFLNVLFQTTNICLVFLIFSDI